MKFVRHPTMPQFTRLGLTNTNFVVFMVSLIPSPLYARYQTAWHFSPAVLTSIYATFSPEVIVTSPVAGRLSDTSGRRQVLLLAVVTEVLSTNAFLLASGVPWLFLGRLLGGGAVALCARAPQRP